MAGKINFTVPTHIQHLCEKQMVMNTVLLHMALHTVFAMGKLETNLVTTSNIGQYLWPSNSSCLNLSKIFAEFLMKHASQQFLVANMLHLNSYMHEISDLYLRNSCNNQSWKSFSAPSSLFHASLIS